MCLVHYRGLRLACLKRLAAASIPVWIQAHTRVLPALVTWLVALLFGFFFVESVLYAVLEHIWAGRWERLGDGGAGAMIHEAWAVPDEIRSGLWYGVGIASVFPWATVALGRVLPPTLHPLSWLTLAMTVLAVTGADSRDAQGGGEEQHGRR